MVKKFKHMFIRFDMIHERKKNRRFHVPQPTFLFPLETPLRLSRNMLHGWKGNSMLAKPLAVCTYVSLYMKTYHKLGSSYGDIKEKPLAGEFPTKSRFCYF